MLLRTQVQRRTTIIGTMLVLVSLCAVPSVTPDSTSDTRWEAVDNRLAKSDAGNYGPEVAAPKDIHSSLARMLERGVQHSTPCKTKKIPKDPRQFFADTKDEFFPHLYIEKECNGRPGPRGYPACGTLMDCVTRTATLYFHRKPKQTGSGCPEWKRVKIPNVPVGCECLVPS